MSYVVIHGLGPYFNQMTVIEMISGHSYFTLHFDETRKRKEKQMDLLVCCWSEVDNQVKLST